MTARDALVLAAASTVVACDVHRPWPGLEPSFERMLVQPHAVAYQSNATFADGQVMRPIPAGTRSYPPRDAIPELSTGNKNRPRQIPILLTHDVLARGRERFTTYCSTCHGILGDGDSPVADRMSLRRPPSLHEARIRAFSPGDLYRTVSEGFGLMPSYQVELPEPERWAVVAYVRALQSSFDRDLRRLPTAMRVEAEGQLP